MEINQDSYLSDEIFFEAIKNANIAYVVKTFRDKSTTPWLYREKYTGFTGKIQ